MAFGETGRLHSELGPAAPPPESGADEPVVVVGGIPTREEAAKAVLKYQMGEFFKSHGYGPEDPPANANTFIPGMEGVGPIKVVRSQTTYKLFGPGAALVVDRDGVEERRLAVLWVNEWDVLDVIVLDNPREVVRAEWPGLPADARVHEVRHEWSRKQFAFVLSSREFPVAPNGAPLPDVPGQVHMRRKRLGVGMYPATYFPDAVKKPMPGIKRDHNPVGWAIQEREGGRHLATFALESHADEYLTFIRGAGR